VKGYVLDANALVRYFRKTPGSVTVYDLFEKAKSGQVRLFVSAVNLTEVIYVLAKYFRQDQALQYIAIARSVVETMPVDDQVALDTAAVRIRYKLGLADCFAAELAMRLGAKLVTADPEFAKFGKQLKVLALPRHAG
jgi:predicted nucleic acid-binding protein